MSLVGNCDYCRLFSLKSLIAIQALLFEHSFIPCQILKDVKAELDRIPVSLVKTLNLKLNWNI